MKLLTYLLYIILGILTVFLGNWIWNIFVAKWIAKNPDKFLNFGQPTE